MTELTIELVEKLAMFTVKKNHTGHWGALVGRHSATFVFMHEDKKKVLEHIRDNYDTYFISKK